MNRSPHGARKLTLYTEVGIRIREAREAAGWSQRKLSDACGTTSTTIGLIERGTTNASLYVVAMVAEALDLTIDELVPVTIDEREAAE